MRTPRPCSSPSSRSQASEATQVGGMHLPQGAGGHVGKPDFYSKSWWEAKGLVKESAAPKPFTPFLPLFSSRGGGTPHSPPGHHLSQTPRKHEEHSVLGWGETAFNCVWMAEKYLPELTEKTFHVVKALKSYTCILQIIFIDHSMWKMQLMRINLLDTLKLWNIRKTNWTKVKCWIELVQLSTEWNFLKIRLKNSFQCS